MKNFLLLIIISVSVLILFLINEYISIHDYSHEQEHSIITKENYKFSNGENKFKINYQGSCEKDIFSRYSKNKFDEKLLDDFILSFKQEMSFNQLDHNKKLLLENLKDRDLAYALDISFKGVDIPIFELYKYKYFCSHVQKTILFLNIIFYIIFLFPIILIYKNMK